MERTTPQDSKPDQQKSTSTDTIPVEISRTFHAPVERVWRAWSNPDTIQQWWGPDTYSCPHAESQFHKDGNYLFAMQGPDGKVVWSGGTYLEVTPNQRLVFTDSFMDEEGGIVPAEHYGMDGDWPLTLKVTVEFERKGDETKMSIVHEGLPAKWHDDCVQGWNSSFDKLQLVVERDSNLGLH